MTKEENSFLLPSDVNGSSSIDCFRRGLIILAFGCLVGVRDWLVRCGYSTLVCGDNIGRWHGKGTMGGHGTVV